MEGLIPLILVFGVIAFITIVGLHFYNESSKRQDDLKKKELELQKSEVEVRRIEALARLAEQGSLDAAVEGDPVVAGAMAEIANEAEEEVPRRAHQQAAAQKAGRKL